MINKCNIAAATRSLQQLYVATEEVIREMSFFMRERYLMKGSRSKKGRGMILYESGKYRIDHNNRFFERA